MSNKKVTGGSREAIFSLQVLYLLVLATLAFLNLSVPNTVPGSLGPIPTGVPWFGALGAVMISLWGVTEHRADWDEAWKYWHWSRPFVGASVAVISMFILKAGILAVGATPVGTQGVTQNFLYFVVAFVVGYREETFRDLLKKVADVILTPAPTFVAPTVSAMNPASGPVAGGTIVTITGAGLTNVSAVRFGSQAAMHLVDSDRLIKATSPEAQSPGTVPVVVRGPGGSANAGPFTYT